MNGRSHDLYLGYDTEIDASIEDVLQWLDRIDKTMIQLSARHSASAHLEKCTDHGQTLLPPKGDLAMANRLRVCVGYNDDGSPVIKRITGDTETELADKAVRAILESERRGEFIPIEDDAPSIEIPTFKEYAEMWLTTYKVGRIKPTTLGGYRTILEAHLYPAFGDALISEIKTATIQEMLNRKKDKSRKTLQDVMILLRAILESAHKDSIIKSNPADDKRISIPSTKKNTRDALKLEDLKEIIAGIEGLQNVDDRRYQALLVYTGMRRGEVLALRWEDADIANGVIHVRRNVTYPRGCNDPCVGTTKTASGVRDVPIIPRLLDFLKPLGTTGFIIGDGEQPNTLSIVRRRNERINRLIDMHGATPHTFRHSFGTLLYDAGASIKDIQAILGQSDFKTTADRYLHPRDESKRTAAKAVGNMLAG